MATSKPEIIIDWAIKQINLPSTNSHKGQNGRLLVIGGSHIFHAASLWSAEIASKFIDLVHYSSTEENQQIFINLKSKFCCMFQMKG
jgi:NAD(P)H-hydrate epimerase